MTPEEIAQQLGGTPQEQAAFRRWQAERRAEQDRRIAAGKTGDIPDELTPEDEAIFRSLARK